MEQESIQEQSESDEDALFQALSDLVQFFHVEQGWEYFRAEFKLSDNPTSSQQNAQLIGERLDKLAASHPKVKEAVQAGMGAAFNP